jgi:hypothetical protein
VRHGVPHAPPLGRRQRVEVGVLDDRAQVGLRRAQDVEQGGQHAQT